MKKNKMMRLASGLMVLTLLTTCTISGTFAKYTTQDDAMDQARVAKWGVVLQAVGNLYGEKYEVYKDVEGEAPESGNVISISDTDTEISVKSSNIGSTDGSITKVIAPGTKNDKGLSLKVEGTPEVEYAVDATVKIQNIFLKEGSYGVMTEVKAEVTSATFASFGDLYIYSTDSKHYTKASAYEEDKKYYTLEDAVELTENYYPVQYTASMPSSEPASSAETTVTGSINEDSLKKVADELVKRLLNVENNLPEVGSDDSWINYDTTDSTILVYDGSAATYQENTEISKGLLTDVKLSWEWKFENGSDNNDKKMYNGADTILGNLMAEQDDQFGSSVKEFAGTVVVATMDDEAVSYYAAPEVDTNYCLETMFDIDITVEQVD